MMNLYMLLRFCLPKISFGHVVEFGSYLGGSAIFFKLKLQKNSYRRLKLLVLIHFLVCLLSTHLLVHNLKDNIMILTSRGLGNL